MSNGRLFDPSAFARVLRVRIAELGIDSRTAASQIGVHPSVVCRICKGKQPTVETYLRITRWLASRQESAPLEEAA